MYNFSLVLYNNFLYHYNCFKQGGQFFNSIFADLGRFEKKLPAYLQEENYRHIKYITNNSKIIVRVKTTSNFLMRLASVSLILIFFIDFYTK